MRPDDARVMASIALDVARAAGELALRGHRQPKRVKHKAHEEIVTEFDIEAERLIRGALARTTPDIPVVAEEEGGQEAGVVWYVDPIDGTVNYSRGHPFWAVSVGLVEHGIPVAGAVVAPSLGLAWHGWMGGLALRNGEACHVSSTDDLRNAMLATGFPYDRRTSQENNFSQFLALKRVALGVRRCGSAAIDLCLVADGTYDGYWEMKLRPWDIAAGAALVLAASGQVTAYDGAPLDLLRGEIVASNGRIHERLLHVRREASGP